VRGHLFFLSQKRHGAAERIMQYRLPLQREGSGARVRSWHVPLRHGCLDDAVLSAIHDVTQRSLVACMHHQPRILQLFRLAGLLECLLHLTRAQEASSCRHTSRLVTLILPRLFARRFNV